MSDDGFKPLDINALNRRARQASARGRARQIREGRTVMREQVIRNERAGFTGADAGPVILSEVRGQARWTLHGNVLQTGQILEMYTNRANGWLRGQVQCSETPEERPSLMLTIWNPWGERDADGLPPRLGRLASVIPEGAMCRWSVALPEEID